MLDGICINLQKEFKVSQKTISSPSLKEFCQKRVFITRKAIQALYYCIPFSTSNIFNYDKLLSYMLTKTKKNKLSYLSAAFTKCIY